MNWDQMPALFLADVHWLQIGGEGFDVRIGSLSISDGWADWLGDNGNEFRAPANKIEVVST